MPTGSLQGSLAGTDVGLPGTLTQPQPMPAPVQAPGIPGAEIPSDFNAVLGSGAFTPEQEALPSGGQQALNAILSTLGGLLQGQPSALVGGILGVRRNVEAIKQRNLEARRKSREEQLKFIQTGMAQTRADRIAEAQQKLDAAKLEGDKTAIDLAQQDLANARTKFGAEQERAAGEQALAEAKLAELRSRINASEDPDKERALDTLGTFTESLLSARRQLNSQLSQGAAEPILKYVDPDTDEVTEIRGVDAIRSELESGLQGAANYAAAFADPSMQDGLNEAFNSMIEPLLEQWTAKVAKTRVEAARAGRERARQKIKSGSRQKPFISFGREDVLPGPFRK